MCGWGEIEKYYNQTVITHTTIIIEPTKDLLHSKNDTRRASQSVEPLVRHSLGVSPCYSNIVYVVYCMLTTSLNPFYHNEKAESQEVLWLQIPVEYAN